MHLIWEADKLYHFCKQPLHRNLRIHHLKALRDIGKDFIYWKFDFTVGNSFPLYSKQLLLCQNISYLIMDLRQTIV